MNVIEWLLLRNKFEYKLAINKVHEAGVEMMRHCETYLSISYGRSFHSIQCQQNDA